MTNKNMTSKEAIAIIRKEYLCVDRDCDIEKNCGKCDLVMLSKEPILKAYKVAIKALEQQPCDDAISRQDALRAFMYATNGERLPDYDCDNYPVTYNLRYIKKTLRALPPVTPQPKIGHWIRKDGYSDCSECDSHIVTEWDYCPKCGAKMIKSQESEGV